MASLSTSCTCNLYCKKRSGNKSLICSHCYAERQMKIYHNLEKCLIKNTEILTNRILDKTELPIINFLYFRFESFGDLININQIVNYFNICKKNPKVHFALWTKNPFVIADAINKGVAKPRNLQIVYSSPMINIVNDPGYDFIDKIFTVYDKKYIKENNVNKGVAKPRNLQIVYSSPMINIVNDPGYDFIDKIFTVYDKKYIKENNVSINCGAEKCLSCGKCYNKSKVRYINEMLK